MACNREGACNSLIKVPQCGQMGKLLPTSSVILGNLWAKLRLRPFVPSFAVSFGPVPFCHLRYCFAQIGHVRVSSNSSKCSKYYGEFCRDCPARSGGRRSLVVWLAQFSGLVASAPPQ